MTPIDDELRTALRDRAQTLTPVPDPLAGIERRARGMQRRRYAAMSGAALSALAVALALPLALGAGDRDRGDQIANNPTPTPSATPPSSSPSPIPTGTEPWVTNDALPWPCRGPLCGDGALRERAFKVWAGKHDLPTRPFHRDLWAGPMAGAGTPRIVVFQGWSEGDERSWLVVYQEHETGTPQLLRDELAPTKEKRLFVSVVLPGDRTPFVLVIGPPTTGQISYAADGAKFAPVETTDGWSLFDRTGPTSSKADLIEILDGNGDLDRPIYRGPLQLGPSDPDV